MTAGPRAGGHGEAAVRVPSGAHARAKHAAILVAARDCFVAEGFDVNLQRVADLADVSKMTIYNHFGSKENLFLAVIDAALSETLNEALGVIEARLTDSADLRADLVAACQTWVAQMGSPEMAQLRNVVVGELRRIPNLAAEWSDKGPRRFHPVIGSALRREVRIGRLSIPDIGLAVLQLSGLVLPPSLAYGFYGTAPSPARTGQLITGGVDMFLSHYGYRPDVTG